MSNVCQCCGGSLPVDSVWESNRDEGGECDGSVDPQENRCRAFAADSLWYCTTATGGGYAVVRGTDGAIAEFLDSDEAEEALDFLKKGKSERRYEWYP